MKDIHLVFAMIVFLHTFAASATVAAPDRSVSPDSSTALERYDRFRQKKKARIEYFFRAYGGFTDPDIGISLGLGIYRHFRVMERPGLYFEHGMRFAFTRWFNTIDPPAPDEVSYSGPSLAYAGTLGAESRYAVFALAQVEAGLSYGILDGENVLYSKKVLIPYAGISAGLGIHIASTILLSMQFGICGSPFVSYQQSDGHSELFSVSSRSFGLYLSVLI